MLPPSKSEFGADVTREVSDLSGNLDRAADEFMKRAARLDPVGFRELAARYPTVALRTIHRPWRVARVDGRLKRIYDVSLDSLRDRSNDE